MVLVGARPEYLRRLPATLFPLAEMLQSAQRFHPACSAALKPGLPLCEEQSPPRQDALLERPASARPAGCLGLVDRIGPGAEYGPVLEVDNLLLYTRRVPYPRKAKRLIVAGSGYQRKFRTVVYNVHLGDLAPLLGLVLLVYAVSVHP